MAPVIRLVSMLIKHIGEDRNKDVVGEDLVRLSVRRIRCGGILVELLC